MSTATTAEGELDARFIKKLQREAKRTDEISFCLGVFNVVLTTYLLSAKAAYFWVFHCLKCAMLLTFRFFKFKAKKWHYFLFDFCYIVNIWSVLYCVLSFFQSIDVIPAEVDAIIFRIAFAWSVGPLAWSIPFFRNALTFHSEDHMTVLFIHASPGFLVWALRWYQVEAEAAFPGMFRVCPNNETYCEASVWDLIILPFLAYLVFWNIPYAIWMFGFRAQRIKQRGYVTMYTYMRSNGGLAATFDGLSDTTAQLTYMCLHGALIFISLLPSVLMWNNEYIHTLWILAVMALATWNGATFYFEVFAERYAAHIKEEVALRLKARKAD